MFEFSELNKRRWLNSLLITLIIFGLLVYIEVRYYGNKFDKDLFKEIVINRYFVYTVIIIRILVEIFGSSPKIIPIIPEPTPEPTPEPIPEPTPEPTPEPSLETIITTTASGNSRIILYITVILVIGASIYGVMKYYNSKHKKSKSSKH